MRPNKIIQLSTFFLFFLISCNSSKKLQEQYCAEISGPDNVVLRFNKDHSYTGLSHSDIVGTFRVKGYWIRSGDTIYLDSKPPSIVDTMITSAVGLPNNEVVIKIIDVARREPIEGVQLSDGKEFYSTAKNGEINFKSIDSKFLFLNYSGITDSVSSSGLAGKSVIINLDFRNLQSFQLSKVWLLKGKKLIPLERNFSIFKRCSR